MKINKLVTHNGSFHADDIFACATLILWLEKKGVGFEILRTREEEVMANGDYVFDVGGIYDPEKNLFDHHQKGGAGKRENGIEYSSFGLVWKKFGKELSGGEKEAEKVEEKLVAPVDAFDNGLDLVENKHKITPYYLQHLFLAFRPTWKETELAIDLMFEKSVKIAKKVLEREIIQARDLILAQEKVLAAYQESEDKRIIILEKEYPFEEILKDFSEPLFVIYPKEDTTFGIKALRKNLKSFENKKDFPASWAGLRGAALAKETGVPEAIFCHRGLFLVVAQTLAGAKKLAALAILN